MNPSALHAQLHAHTAGAVPDVQAEIGPNAVIQTLRALRQLEGPELEARVFAAAGIPEREPGAMIPESWFLRLVRSLRAELPADRAAAVLRLAGRYTADYVACHRIPVLFRKLLGILPRRIGVPMLLAAFRRHAWTFAGSSGFSVNGAFPGAIMLDDTPTCREAAGLAESGSYYEAAFAGLLGLAAPGTRVIESACRAQGSERCRFDIHFANDRERG
jgi:divinyl protochlorophyllide a 8-vinyl-reductase